MGWILGHKLIRYDCSFSLSEHENITQNDSASVNNTKMIYTMTFSGEFMSSSLHKWSCFEKTSVYTDTDKGKSRFDWLLNNANRHDKNGALKSAFDKHEPGSHKEADFDIKGFFPRLCVFVFFCRSVGGRPLSWIWAAVKCWFREGLGVLAVILWKQTNRGNQSHCLEEVKVPFHLLYQPWLVSLKIFVLYSKCSVGLYIFVILPNRVLKTL